MLKLIKIAMITGLVWVFLAEAVPAVNHSLEAARALHTAQLAALEY